jgi:hypothetical protein
MSKNETQTFRLTVSSHKNAIVFRMTWFSLIYVTDTEWNITSKHRKRCYKKYSVHRSIVNIGITNYTTATITKTLHDFSQVVKNIYET